MRSCGEAQGQLAAQCVDYEARVDSDVLAPLQQLTEVSFCAANYPNFPKLKTATSRLLQCETSGLTHCLTRRVASVADRYSYYSQNTQESVEARARHGLSQGQVSAILTLTVQYTTQYDYNVMQACISRFIMLCCHLIITVCYAKSEPALGASAMTHNALL